MKSFRLLAIAATVAVFLLIFIGGLVRVSGAGMGCPDWPKCFGSWFPPVDIRQLPPDFDPSTFNFTLAWIEYINRLFGVTTGILVAIVAILAIKNYRKSMRILLPSAAAGLMIAFQGWQGGRVVLQELEPVLVSAHLVIAVIIATLMLYVAQTSYYLDHREERALNSYPLWLKLLALLSWAALSVQIILGARLRETIEETSAELPLLSGEEILTRAADAVSPHMILGMLFAAGAFLLGLKVLSVQKATAPLLRQTTWAVMGMAFVQVILGLTLYAVGNPPVGQVLHLWVSSVMAGFAMVMFVGLLKGPEAG